MEFFQPMIVNWEGKLEPLSPSSQDSSLFKEEFIHEAYDFCNDDLFNNALFDIEVDTKPVLTSDLMKETPILITVPAAEKCSKDQWLDQKLKQQPQLAAVASGCYVQQPSLAVPEIGPFSHQQQPQKVILQNTEQLLMEFDYVYENVELTHLTPPQTPPQEECSSSQTYCGEQQSQQFGSVDSQPPQYYGSYGSSPLNGLLVDSVQTIAPEALQQVPVPEYQLADSFGFQPVDEVENIARNLELVEEIVRSRSKDLPDYNDDASCSFSEAGSDSSPMSDDSGSSYCGSAYSHDLEDEEWSPLRGGSKKIGKVSGGGVTKKRSARPYGRGVEDKKSRKKEQNKNAATRYRQKKKAEIEIILEEENKLKDKHDALKGKSADIGREIRYLKSLMREVFKAKGLIQ